MCILFRFKLVISFPMVFAVYCYFGNFRNFRNTSMHCTRLRTDAAKCFGKVRILPKTMRTMVHCYKPIIFLHEDFPKTKFAKVKFKLCGPNHSRVQLYYSMLRFYDCSAWHIRHWHKYQANAVDKKQNRSDCQICEMRLNSAFTAQNWHMAGRKLQTCIILSD